MKNNFQIIARYSAYLFVMIVSVFKINEMDFVISDTKILTYAVLFLEAMYICKIESKLHEKREKFFGIIGFVLSCIMFYLMFEGVSIVLRVTLAIFTVAMMYLLIRLLKKPVQYLFGIVIACICFFCDDESGNYFASIKVNSAGKRKDFGSGTMQYKDADGNIVGKGFDFGNGFTQYKDADGNIVGTGLDFENGFTQYKDADGNIVRTAHDIL